MEGSRAPIFSQRWAIGWWNNYTGLASALQEGHTLPHSCNKCHFAFLSSFHEPFFRFSGSGLESRWLWLFTEFDIGQKFAAALLPRLFRMNPRPHHKGTTGRVRTGDQRLPVLFHWANLDKTSLTNWSSFDCTRWSVYEWPITSWWNLKAVWEKNHVSRKLARSQLEPLTVTWMQLWNSGAESDRDTVQWLAS